MAAKSFERQAAERLYFCFDMFDLGADIAKPEALEPLLESLVAVGLAPEAPTATGGRAWRTLR